MGVVTALHGMGVLSLSLDADRPPSPVNVLPSPPPTPAAERRRDGASWFSIRSLLRGDRDPAPGGSLEAAEARVTVARVVEECDVGGLLGEMRFLPEEGLVAVLHTLVQASAAALSPPDGPAGPAGPGSGGPGAGAGDDWRLLPLRLALGLAGLNRDRVDTVWAPLVPHLSDVLARKPPASLAWQLRAGDGLMALAGYAAGAGSGARAVGQVDRVLRGVAGLGYDALHPLAATLAQRLTPLVRGRGEGLAAGGAMGGLLCLMGALVTAAEGSAEAVQAIHEAVG
jgi:hypothetical protein